MLLSKAALFKIFKKKPSKELPSNTQKEVYNSTKFSSLLNNSKDVTTFEEKHDVVYRPVCASADCNADNVGECPRRLNEHG